MEWKPIETAPTNQAVLVAVSNGQVTIGCKGSNIGWYWEPTDDEDDDSYLSHWMPLPKPPKESHADASQES